MPSLASLLNLGGPDLVIILGIVLLLFGAKKLPDIARNMAQAIRESPNDDDGFNLSGLEILAIAIIIVTIAFLLAAASS